MLLFLLHWENEADLAALLPFRPPPPPEISNSKKKKKKTVFLFAFNGQEAEE